MMREGAVKAQQEGERRKPIGLGDPVHPKEMKPQCISLAGWKLEEGFAKGVGMSRVL